VSSDLDDRLERLAQDKGVGAFVTPPAVSDRSGEGAKPAADEVSPRGRRKSLNLELPDYVWTELKIRAARNETSVRHIVMTALLGEGITIEDADMIEDGRRLR
jgi:hypothetical protein